MSQAPRFLSGANRIRRYLSVFDSIDDAPGHEFFFLLTHSKQIRDEFAVVLTRVPRSNAIAFLEGALADSDPGVVLGAIGCLAKLNATEVLDTVARLMSVSEEERFLSAACTWLGTSDDHRAIVPLAGKLHRRPRLFGLVGGPPEGARLTAVRALSRMDLPSARTALWMAQKGSSGVVREAIRRALVEGK